MDFVRMLRVLTYCLETFPDRRAVGMTKTAANLAV